MIPCPSCNWCQAPACWGDQVMEDFSPLVFHLYAGLPPAGHLGVSGGWGPPDWPGGWILSVLEGNHLRERAGLRWRVHSSVPLQVPLTLLSSFMCVCVCVSSRLHSCSWSGNALIVKHWELKVRCWLDVYRMNSFYRREQEVIWTVQVLQSVCRSQLFKKPPIFYGIRVLTIKFTIVGRLLLTPELLYGAQKSMKRVGV